MKRVGKSFRTRRGRAVCTNTLTSACGSILRRLRRISVVLLRHLISPSRTRIDRGEFLCGFVRTPRTPHGCRFRRKFRFVACFRLSVEIRQWYCAMQNILSLSLALSLSIARARSDRTRKLSTRRQIIVYRRLHVIYFVARKRSEVFSAFTVMRGSY